MKNRLHKNYETATMVILNRSKSERLKKQYDISNGLQKDEQKYQNDYELWPTRRRRIKHVSYLTKVQNKDGVTKKIILRQQYHRNLSIANRNRKSLKSSSKLKTAAGKTTYENDYFTKISDSPNSLLSVKSGTGNMIAQKKQMHTKNKEISIKIIQLNQKIQQIKNHQHLQRQIYAKTVQHLQRMLQMGSNGYSESSSLKNSIELKSSVFEETSEGQSEKQVMQQYGMANRC